VVQTAQECSINIVMLAQLRMVNAGLKPTTNARSA
jgi:hypothetical protein